MLQTLQQLRVRRNTLAKRPDTEMLLPIPQKTISIITEAAGIPPSATAGMHEEVNANAKMSLHEPYLFPGRPAFTSNHHFGVSADMVFCIMDYLPASGSPRGLWVAPFAGRSSWESGMKRLVFISTFSLLASITTPAERHPLRSAQPADSASSDSPWSAGYSLAGDTAPGSFEPSSPETGRPPDPAVPAATETIVVVDGVKYPCSGAGVIAAITDAYAQLSGIVDARGCQSLVSTSEIDVGTTAGYPLTLLVPNFGIWTFSLNNSGLCGIKQFTHSSIIGTAPAGGGSFSLIAASGASMYSLLCTDPSPKFGGSYILSSGVSAGNPNRAFMGGALITFQHLFDSSETDRIMAYNFVGIRIQFTDFCCGAIFKNTVSDGYGNPGAAPVLIGGGPQREVRSLQVERSTV